MKTLQSFAEILLAIPVGIISVPVLFFVFIVKAFLPAKSQQAVLVRMDNTPALSRNAG